MTFSYNNAVPATNNNPSDDQPDMLINTESIEDILAVDHISFNTAGGGQHLQSRYNATPTYIAAPGAQSGNNSIAYTQAGTASTAAQYLFKNSNVAVQLSAIRAWATCDSTGAFLGSQRVNVTSVSLFSTGVYNVVLATNAVSSNQFAVLIAASSNGTPGMKYLITGVGTFQLQFFTTQVANPLNPTSFSFQVMQI
jgi:hypothetical protein